MRYSKLLRYFKPKFCAAERLLVALNFYQNFYIMCFFVNIPLLLRISHEARRRGRGRDATHPVVTQSLPQILLGDGFPIYGVAKYVLGTALLLQLVYGASPAAAGRRRRLTRPRRLVLEHPPVAQLAEVQEGREGACYLAQGAGQEGPVAKETRPEALRCQPSRSYHA